MSDRKTVFVLGAPDPESMFLFRTLTACGFIVEWATCGGVPVSPRTAYEADVVEIQNRYYNPVFVWVECLPRECSRAKLEGCHGDKLIDHHNPGDKGYGRSEAEAFEASSVGQLADLALVMAASASSEERAKGRARATADPRRRAATARGDGPAALAVGAGRGERARVVV